MAVMQQHGCQLPLKPKEEEEEAEGEEELMMQEENLSEDEEPKNDEGLMGVPAPQPPLQPEQCPPSSPPGRAKSQPPAPRHHAGLSTKIRRE